MAQHALNHQKSIASEHSETLFKKSFKNGKSDVMTHTIPVLQRQEDHSDAQGCLSAYLYTELQANQYVIVCYY